MITDVAWAVQTRQGQETRPAKLVQHLIASGAVAEGARYWRHGSRVNGDGEHVPWRTLASRRLPVDPRRTAVLSPAFLRSVPAARWVDLYDDWSLAPDIHPVLRLLAACSYRTAAVPRLLTVNSLYMAAKLYRLNPVLVPNGVDAGWADITLQPGTAPSLLILGTFLRGRTDVQLLRRIVALGVWERVVLAGFRSTGRGSLSPADILPEKWDRRIEVLKHVRREDLPSLINSATVAAVPHRLRDYTASQDVMKIYQFQALGLKVICPRMLWPQALSPRHGFLLDRGVELDEAVTEWCARPGPDPAERQQIVEEHGWAARARVVQRSLLS